MATALPHQRINPAPRAFLRDRLPHAAAARSADTRSQLPVSSAARPPLRAAKIPGTRAGRESLKAVRGTFDTIMPDLYAPRRQRCIAQMASKALVTTDFLRTAFG